MSRQKHLISMYLSSFLWTAMHIHLIAQNVELSIAQSPSPNSQSLDSSASGTSTLHDTGAMWHSIPTTHHLRTPLPQTSLLSRSIIRALLTTPYTKCLVPPPARPNVHAAGANYRMLRTLIPSRTKKKQQARKTTILTVSVNLLRAYFKYYLLQVGEHDLDVAMRIVTGSEFTGKSCRSSQLHMRW